MNYSLQGNHSENQKIFSSFRDPAGFVFEKEGVLYRQVNPFFKEEYDFFVSCGLFEELIKKGYLISHKEVSTSLGKRAYKILKPQRIPFISYPYEWSFSQYKDAAILTLKIQKMALEKGMILKDASAFNVQFFEGKPIFIDILSFRRYKKNEPWVAYRQFCEHFLAPLTLMAKSNIHLYFLPAHFLKGVPISLVASLLPKKSYFSFGLLTHLFLQSKIEQKYIKNPQQFKKKNHFLPLQRLLNIIDNLEKTILKLNLPKEKTIWGDYYQKTFYSREAFENKKRIVERWLLKLKPKIIWDAGANEGEFSKIASEQRIFTIASDFDPLAVEKCYLYVKRKKDKYLLPLIVDLTNPTPALGWKNKERISFLNRAHFDVVLALALIHHLTIGNNLPFSYIGEFFAKVSRYLIIEFVPKQDKGPQRLLEHREDIFEDYRKEVFEKEFSAFFEIIEKKPIKNTSRILYLMKRK